jgi:UDP-N-acetyl-D-mannosaminuronic acid dehydrogenase
MNDTLLAAIEDRGARVVVIGLGYVGLPVACLFAEAGFPVTGVELNRARVERINRGECPIEGDEPGLPELVRRVVDQGRLRATADYGSCRQAQVVLIAVETPVDPADHKPRYEALRSALHSLGQHLQRGTLVIIESTIAPGTMKRVVRPVLEETSGLAVNVDFHLVNCPERLMPGKLLANIRGCARVVGGSSPAATAAAVALYRHIVHADLDPVHCLTAELVKTMENTYRDVQIAFANEMALLCEDLGADVWQVRELVNKSPNRQMHLPGAGVGGHCIPKDPWLLVAFADPAFRPRIVPAARAINDGMPLHVARLTVRALSEAGVDIAHAKVTVLGYAYLENSDDTRNSPSAVLVERLRELGADVVVHDPFVPEYQRDLVEAIVGCDALVLMVGHQAYRSLDLAQLRSLVGHPLMIDGRHIFSPRQVEAAGWTYSGVGVGAGRGGL